MTSTRRAAITLNAAAQRPAASPIRVRTREGASLRASMILRACSELREGDRRTCVRRRWVRYWRHRSNRIDVADGLFGNKRRILCRQLRQRGKLRRGPFGEIKMALRKRGNAAGLRHPRPFGTKQGERVLFADDRGAGFAKLRARDPRFLGNSVETKTDKSRDRDEGEIQRAYHGWSPLLEDADFETGASVRSAARRRAERARGLALISSSLGTCGCLPTRWNVGSRASARAGAWREPLPARPERSTKNRFTMRSSSE